LTNIDYVPNKPIHTNKCKPLRRCLTTGSTESILWTWAKALWHLTLSRGGQLLKTTHIKPWFDALLLSFFNQISSLPTSSSFFVFFPYGIQEEMGNYKQEDNILTKENYKENSQKCYGLQPILQQGELFC
jgi:hypothetical protein